MDGQHPRRAGRGWWIVGGIFAVLVLAAGALSAASWLARHIEVQNQTYRQTVQQIRIDIDDGDVTLRPAEPGVSGLSVHRKLTWSWSRPTLSETWDGQTLHLTVDCPAINVGPGCSVDYTIVVPQQVSVVSHSGAGDITVTGVHGDLTLSTSVGDLWVTDAPGVVSLRSSTGDITTAGLTSPTVEAHTSTGDVILRFAASPTSVRATTRTGDVDVTVPPGAAYRVSATTSTGDVTVSVPQDPSSPRAIDAHTSTGDITIRSA